jgi:hypothetical protein
VESTKKFSHHQKLIKMSEATEQAAAVLPATQTAPVIDINPARGQGRGNHRGGRGRLGRGNHSSRGRGRSGVAMTKAACVFKGNTDGMEENVFQCFGESTDKQQFLKTVGVLSEHINKTFQYPQDVASVCKSFKLTTLVQPKDLSEEECKSMGKKLIWETKIKTYIKRVDEMVSNTRAIYAIVWGQCSPMMQSKLESLDSFSDKSEACDCIWLLKEIQGITHKFEGTRNVFISLHDAWSNYYSYKQQSDQSLHAYLKDFQSLVQVLEHYGAAFGAEEPF